MAQTNTTIVVAVVIAIILVAVAGYYIATRHPVTTTLPTTTTLSTTTISVVTTTTTSTTTTTTSTTTTTTSKLPSGAVALPYDASNHTVFLNIVSLSTGNPFNFNGTSGGQLHIYIPAGWTVIVTYTNQESIPHNFNIVQNSTTTPNNANIGADGKIIFSVGTTSSTYETNGISSGASASGSTSLPAGIYWFACGIAGHAESGMWGVIISSTSITTPYETS